MIYNVFATNQECADVSNRTEPNNEHLVMSATEVALMLGISQITLLRMRQRPSACGLPFVQLSQHRIGYLRADVLAYLAARRVGALPEAA